jgi:hypothetical protein
MAKRTLTELANRALKESRSESQNLLQDMESDIIGFAEGLEENELKASGAAQLIRKLRTAQAAIKAVYQDPKASLLDTEL